MKRYVMSGLACMMLANVAANAAPPASTAWWSYLAAYDDGPGSIRVDMQLKKSAPISGFPVLIVTGVTYTSTQKNGLPDTEDLDRLNDISNAVVSAIAARTPSHYAGTFTNNFEQLNYIYVPSAEGVDDAIKSVYRQKCADCKTYLNIKNDATWSGYRDFLFPNEATLKHYGLLRD